VKKSYHTIGNKGIVNEKKLGELMTREGQMVLPPTLVDLVTECRAAVDDLVWVTGRAVIEQVVQLSAEQVAGGPPHRGQTRAGEIGFYGHQTGSVQLGDRKLGIRKPRLRRTGEGGGEVQVPAYAAMQNPGRTQQQMLGVLMRGVSTRAYAEVIPQMAETVGVSKSAVSRQVKVASEAELKKLLDKPLGDLRLLVVYIDGMGFGEHLAIGAVGIDEQGAKHVLGIVEGATENAAAATDLLENLVSRGLDPKQKLLFVIDGSKGLRTAINHVFGEQHPVQRCRTHKLRNVLEHLPKDQRDQASALIKAAWKLTAKDGMAKLKKLAEWLEQSWPAAAASLREAMEECFTVNRLEIPASLHRCLVTTNLIESPHSGVRMRTRRVCRWRDGKMVLRWAAAAWLETEKNFRKVMGYKDLWALKAILRPEASFGLPKQEKVA
jgi:putative transposase